MKYIGNHLSASKGYLAMGKQIVKLGGSCFAFFTRNPRGGKAKEIDEADIEKFLSFKEENHIGTLVAHAPYTMNLCAAKEDVKQFSKEMLIDDVKRMEYLPGNFYNFHPGSHVGQGTDAAIPMIAEALNEALPFADHTTVLLETMAGKGSEVGKSFEELKKIMDLTERKDRLGVCFDTCHTWDAGYDIVGDFDRVLKQFDEIIGLSYLKAIHLNDSMNERGAHKDRHEKLGKGFIGMEGLKNIVCHQALDGKPFILETPNEDEGYREEIALVKEWWA